jgi:hypothetical protein
MSLTSRISEFTQSKVSSSEKVSAITLVVCVVVLRSRPLVAETSTNIIADVAFNVEVTRIVVGVVGIEDLFELWINFRSVVSAHLHVKILAEVPVASVGDSPLSRTNCLGDFSLRVSDILCAFAISIRS